MTREEFLPADSRPAVAHDLARRAWEMGQALRAGEAARLLRPGPPELAPAEPCRPKQAPAAGVLLVFASPNDETADVVLEDLKLNGWNCCRVRDQGSLALTLSSNRDGGAEVSLALGPERCPVVGVINRGIWMSQGVTGFHAAEWAASWWAMLATLPVPVVNRPCAEGMLPRIDAFGQGRLRLPFCFGETQIRDFLPRLQPHLSANVYRCADGAFVGRIDGGRQHPGGLGTGPWKIRIFNPAHLVHLFIVGRYVFNLLNPGGAPSQRDVAVCEAWSATLARFGTPFCHLVMERDDTHDRTIVLDPTPHLACYRHLRREIHHALETSLLS